MPQRFTEEEIADFLAQVDGFRRTLAPRQQHILDTLLEAAAGGATGGGFEADVEGFAWQPEQQWSVDPKRVVLAVRQAATKMPPP